MIARDVRLAIVLQEAADEFFRHEYGREQRRLAVGGDGTRLRAHPPTSQGVGATREPVSSFAYKPEPTDDEAARDEQFAYVVSVTEVRLR